mmetsp:Transcript_109278/g.315836  ORF Transcript_109278/g.315836 Transcript_109278/m.315836 type:complete len:245 (-) Transcript_109278:126-860(-)
MEHASDLELPRPPQHVDEHRQTVAEIHSEAAFLPLDRRVLAAHGPARPLVARHARPLNAVLFEQTSEVTVRRLGQNVGPVGKRVPLKIGGQMREVFHAQKAERMQPIQHADLVLRVAAVRPGEPDEHLGLQVLRERGVNGDPAAIRAEQPRAAWLELRGPLLGDADLEGVVLVVRAPDHHGLKVCVAEHLGRPPRGAEVEPTAAAAGAPLVRDPSLPASEATCIGAAPKASARRRPSRRRRRRR